MTTRELKNLFYVSAIAGCTLIGGNLGENFLTRAAGGVLGFSVGCAVVKTVK